MIDKFKLAIVIPLYKSYFLSEALESIANQTNKQFTVYIGDDCSPEYLYHIVKKYETKIRIVYKRFDENLGGRDLVAQWNRCIELVGEEEWIWLFSDDDLMDNKCVENFYQTIYIHPDFDLFHFNVQFIDENNNKTQDIDPYPVVLRSEDFLDRRLHEKINSTVVEYIFRKSHFLELGGFQKFDLAWGTDDATWIKLGNEKGIKNIDNSLVFWRKSIYNISPNYWDKELIKRKLSAEREFAQWVYGQVETKQIRLELLSFKRLINFWFFEKVKGRIEYVPISIIKEQLSDFYNSIHKKKCPKRKIYYLYLFRIYRFFAKKLKYVISTLIKNKYSQV